MSLSLIVLVVPRHPRRLTKLYVSLSLVEPTEKSHVNVKQANMEGKFRNLPAPGLKLYFKWPMAGKNETFPQLSQ